MISIVDPFVGRACLAFNVQLSLSETTRSGLAEVQRRIGPKADAALWAVPMPAMHVSLTPLLSVRKDYAGPKEELWQRKSGEWLASVRAGVRRVGFWEIHFNRIVVTDSAIVVTADDGGVTNTLRQAWALPESAGMTFVHTTLFRYQVRFEITNAWITSLQTLSVSLRERVREVLVVRERVYPSQETDVLERIPVSAERAV